MTKPGFCKDQRTRDDSFALFLVKKKKNDGRTMVTALKTVNVRREFEALVRLKFA